MTEDQTFAMSLDQARKDLKLTPPEGEYVEIANHPPLKYLKEFTQFDPTNIGWILDFFLYATIKTADLNDPEVDEITWLWENVLVNIPDRKVVCEIVFGLGIIVAEYLHAEYDS